MFATIRFVGFHPPAELDSLVNQCITRQPLFIQVRKEYEMLRIEFEQNLAANEQTGPINKEMRNLISSLQTHNMQLKGEVAR